MQIRASISGLWARIANPRKHQRVEIKEWERIANPRQHQRVEIKEWARIANPRQHQRVEGRIANLRQYS